MSAEKNTQRRYYRSAENTKKVTSFKYLSTMLKDKCDDDNDEEVCIRVGHAKSTYGKLRTYVLYLASVTIWCGNLDIEDRVD